MTIYTPPAFVVPGEADAAQHNLHVVDNLLHLKEQEDARGLVARHVLTTNSVGYTVTGNSDMTVTCDFDADRDYVLHAFINPQVSVAAARWYYSFSINGTIIDRFYDQEAETLGILGVGYVPYRPAADLTSAVVRIHHTEVSGAATMTYAGATATTPRYLAVEDIGPRA